MDEVEAYAYTWKCREEIAQAEMEIARQRIISEHISVMINAFVAYQSATIGGLIMAGMNPNFGKSTESEGGKC
jgi:hypothetical protein